MTLKWGGGLSFQEQAALKLTQHKNNEDLKNRSEQMEGKAPGAQEPECT